MAKKYHSIDEVMGTLSCMPDFSYKMDLLLFCHPSYRVNKLEDYANYHYTITSHGRFPNHAKTTLIRRFANKTFSQIARSFVFTGQKHDTLHFRECVTHLEYTPLTLSGQQWAKFKDWTKEAWNNLRYDYPDSSDCFDLKVMAECLCDQYGVDDSHPLVAHIMEFDVHTRFCWAVRRLYFGQYCRTSALIQG